MKTTYESLMRKADLLIEAGIRVSKSGSDKGINMAREYQTKAMAIITKAMALTIHQAEVEV